MNRKREREQVFLRSECVASHFFEDATQMRGREREGQSERESLPNLGMLQEDPENVEQVIDRRHRPKERHSIADKPQAVV